MSEPTPPRESGSRPALTPGRWREVQEVFRGAVEREGAAREAYLRRACGSAEWLREEVDSLLAAHAEGPLHPDPSAGDCVPTEFLPDAGPDRDPVFDLLRLELGDRYEMEERLGAGGMGAVYSAQDLKHGRRVAIKVLHPWLAPVAGGQRFRQEILITAGLQHPHIVPLIDSGVARGLHYYVMPYLRGETLRHHLEREHRLPPGRVARIGRDVLGALEHAHAAGVVHRDIKPENLCLAADQALVFDFGIAAGVFPDDEAVGDPTESGLLLGTPRYMAPEQADEEAGPGSDLFALGAVLFEAASGGRWRTGATAETVDWTDVPPVLRPALQRALRTDPKRRWPSAAAFRDALEEVARDGAPGFTMGRLPARAASATLAAVLAVGLAAGWALWGGDGPKTTPDSPPATPAADLEVHDLHLRAQEDLRAASYGWADTRELAERARRRLRRAVEADPSFAPAWAALSEAYALRIFTDGPRWADSALEAGREALRLDPSLAEAHVAVGYALHWQGEQDLALSHLEEAMARSPSSARANALTATILHAGGRWDEALGYALRAASLEPAEPAHMETVGRIYQDLGLHGDAVRWFRHRLEREPENASSRAWLAYVRMLSGDDERAGAILDTALALQPSSVRALQMSYVRELRRGDPAAAERHVRRLMAEVSDRYRPLVTLGCVLWRLGRRDEAEAVFRRAEVRALEGIDGRRPLALDAHVDLARIHAIRGERDEALRWLREAVKRGWVDHQYTRLDPRLETLRGEAEFRELLRRMEERVAAMHDRAISPGSGRVAARR